MVNVGASEEVKIHLNLVQAYNLKRSYVDPSFVKTPFSPLTSPSEGPIFEAEGVFARIFPLQKVKNASCLSRYGKEETDLYLPSAAGDESLKEEVPIQKM